MDYTNEQIKAAAECCANTDACAGCPLDDSWECGETIGKRLLSLESENADLRAKLAAKETILNGTYIDIGTYNHDTATLRAKLAESEKREKAAVYGMSKKQVTALNAIFECDDIIKKLYKSTYTARQLNVELQYAGNLADRIIEGVEYIREWRGVQAEKE